jgi:hypothetical protein
MSRPISPESNGPRERWNAHEALIQPKEVPMGQTESALSPSHPTVQQVAGAINAMIAERAAEHLGKAPTRPEPSLKPRRTRSGCCARAASGQTTAPPTSVRNSRRFTWPLVRAEECSKTISSRHEPHRFTALNGSLSRRVDLMRSSSQLSSPQIRVPQYPRFQA